MTKTAVTAFLTDSEAGVSGTVIASGLGMIALLNDPLHKIAVFIVCAIMAMSYAWARTFKKTNENNTEAMKAEAQADKAESQAAAAEAYARVKEKA